MSAGRSRGPARSCWGFTAALLYVGAATVVSSVARVADDAAVGIMTAYHRALSAGSRPAEALALAAVHEAPPDEAPDALLTPFVCFGAG